MYEVNITYAGIDQYQVFKDGKEVYFGWSCDEILKKFGVHPNDMKRRADNGKYTDTER